MSPAVELLAIGNELLLGETADTNSTWIARRLAAEGIVIARKTTVGDDVAVIRAALHDALHRTHAVLCTGGLGPTPDDLTRHAVAMLYGRALHIDEEWLDVLRARYQRRGIAMPASNRVQGEIPEGATLLPNDNGTAPGIAIADDALGLTVLLPGVPMEMRGLMDHHVVPLLRARFGTAAPVTSRILRTAGLSEAVLAERIEDIACDVAPLTLAFLPHGTGVDLRLTSWGALHGAALDRAFERVLTRLRERLGDNVYADDERDIAVVVGELLRERGFTLALAESCTGGLVSKRMSDAAGASDYLRTALVTYSNDAKHQLLGVRRETLAAHGAVSELCARELAEGARRVGSADVGVSITGIAGPGGGSDDKPVGTVWFAVAVRGRDTIARRFVLPGTRTEIRERAAQAAIDMVRRALLAHDAA
ncbi:MAG TPA: competence/damage-inducible protein A [Longimicrobiales bacterium]|nr:competence/damage-inducible protein A [Longimicrobiales bacterium]